MTDGIPGDEIESSDDAKRPVKRLVMPRYGIKFNGPQSPLATEMPDGYWTPWHVAQQEIERLQNEVAVQSYWGPKWEAEHRECVRLRGLLEKHGIEA